MTKRKKKKNNSFQLASHEMLQKFCNLNLHRSTIMGGTSQNSQIDQDPKIESRLVLVSSSWTNKNITKTAFKSPFDVEKR